MVLRGVQNVFGTPSDIVAASGTYVPGFQYVETSTGFYTGTLIRFGEAISTTVINWRVTQSQIDTLTQAIAVEVAAREQADTALGVRIDGETQNRISGDAANALAISNEANLRANADTLLQGAIQTVATDLVTEAGRAIAREDAIEQGYISANTAQSTTLLAAFQNAMDIYADADVRSVKTVSYADAATLDMATILGANPVDGDHAIRFVGSTVSDVATVSGIGLSEPNTGDVTFGDILIVTVDDGTIVSTVKSDDITKQIWEALTADITALQAATTVTAIRSHFDATGFSKYLNGVVSTIKSTDAGNDVATGIDGNIYVSVNGAITTYTNSKGTNTTVNVGDTFTDIYLALEDMATNGAFGAVNGTQKVGSNVELGGALTKETTITGDFGLNFMTTSVRANSLDLACWTVNPDGTRLAPSATEFTKVWFDLQNGINYVRATSPN